MSDGSTTLGVHLNDGQLTGKIDHQSHQYSGGPYPVVFLELGSFSLTIYPGRERALELADVLTRMAVDLRAGAEINSVAALQE